MIRLALLTTLIVVTYGNDVKVTENLTEDGCRQAACVVAFGRSCEEQKSFEAEERKRWAEERAAQAAKEAAWEAANPKIVAACKVDDAKEAAFTEDSCYNRHHLSALTLSAGVTYTRPDAPRYVRCVR